MVLKETDLFDGDGPSRGSQTVKGFGSSRNRWTELEERDRVGIERPSNEDGPSQDSREMEREGDRLVRDNLS